MVTANKRHAAAVKAADEATEVINFFQKAFTERRSRDS